MHKYITFYKLFSVLNTQILYKYRLHFLTFFFINIYLQILLLNMTYQQNMSFQQNSMNMSFTQEDVSGSTNSSNVYSSLPMNNDFSYTVNSNPMLSQENNISSLGFNDFIEDIINKTVTSTLEAVKNTFLDDMKKTLLEDMKKTMEDTIKNTVFNQFNLSSSTSLGKFLNKFTSILFI